MTDILTTIDDLIGDGTVRALSRIDVATLEQARDEIVRLRALRAAIFEQRRAEESWMASVDRNNVSGTADESASLARANEALDALLATP